MCLVHASLVPVLGTVGEQKSKPTQHGVKVRVVVGLAWSRSILCCISAESTPPPLFCYLHYIFRSSGGLDCIRMLSHADVVICFRRELGNTIERTPHFVVALPLPPETPCFDCNKITFISSFVYFLKAQNFKILPSSGVFQEIYNYK